MKDVAKSTEVLHTGEGGCLICILMVFDWVLGIGP